MPSYSKQFTKGIEDRVKNGTLKIASSFGAQTASDDVPRKTAAKTNAIENLQALGRMKAGKMNKTEREYSQYLDALIACGDVLWWKFDAVNLRLADNLHYRVDFLVMLANGSLEGHEVKGGHAFDDSIVKLKMANELYPWPFYLVKKKKGGGWNITKVGNKK
ncbi:hypothetical protein [Nitrosomonas marina]|uniref:DUF1064 domain-containing protein n=1 Tax=Nitrosomonas marina TaxID=917 RepID=A0A1H8J323_9PROT|nr:hypothetical protein [Nitrosomonas marina]SEN75234.1 hypothetical protein SAMN05216325_1523 [Nitrosomonas marina]